MIDITGRMTLFGLDFFGVSISQLIVFLCVVAILFLFILEAEFRQLRRLAKKMDEEELTLAKDLRELKDSVRQFGDVLKQSFDFDVDPQKTKEGKDNIQGG